MNQRTRPRSSKSRARSAASSAKPRESSDEFCKRLGIRTVNEKGGVEFSPYHGGNLSAKKPTPGTHKKPEAKLSPEEQKMMREAVAETREYQREQTRIQAEKALTELKAKGMTFNEIAPAEYARMQQATKAVAERFSADFDQGKVKLFNAELERLRTAN